MISDPPLVSFTPEVKVAKVEEHIVHGAAPPTRTLCQINSIGWDSDVDISRCFSNGWPEVGPTIFRLLFGSRCEFFGNPTELIRVFTAYALAAPRDVGW